MTAMHPGSGMNGGAGEPGPILLVEDNEDDVLLTLRALRKNDVANRVVVARDGVEAIAALFGEDGHEPPLPRLILLDLKLPRRSGMEVLRAVRAHPRTKLLPVVVLTSSREEQDLLDSYSLGANSYIRKPIDFEQFVETVRQLGLYWLVWNEAPPVPGGT